jgi:hypothetical protein
MVEVSAEKLNLISRGLNIIFGGIFILLAILKLSGEVLGV